MDAQHGRYILVAEVLGYDLYGNAREKVLNLRTLHREPGFAVFETMNGDKVEVFGPDDREHAHFATGPVAGFGVDDVEEARAEMEAAGVEFIGPVRRWEDGGSSAHFRGPDGNVYEITGVPPAPRDT